MSQESNMHAGGESDGCVLPSKCPNNSGPPLAEGMEGRQPDGARLLSKAIGAALQLATSIHFRYWDYHPSLGINLENEGNGTVYEGPVSRRKVRPSDPICEAPVGAPSQGSTVEVAATRRNCAGSHPSNATMAGIPWSRYHGPPTFGPFR